MPTLYKYAAQLAKFGLYPFSYAFNKVTFTVINKFSILLAKNASAYFFVIKLTDKKSLNV